MNFPDETPKINPLPFIIADIVLLITALFIAIESPSPLATLPLVAITACVALGAILACIPIVLNYTRRCDVLLDERQAELAALAQTAAAAANQLSIAASSLHNIAESTARMLKHADALPARLQEKIAEFKIQLNEVNIAENEALEQEISTLRTSETERLETALENIKKTAAEIISHETGVQKQSDDAARQLAHISAELKTSLEAISAQIPGAIETSRRSLEESIVKSIETRNAEALKRLAAELAAIENGIKERLAAWLAEQAAKKIPSPPPEPPPAAPAHMQVQPKNTPKPGDTVTSNAGDDMPAANSEPPFKKTPRRPPASERAQDKANSEKTILQPEPPPESPAAETPQPEAAPPDEPPAPPPPADETSGQPPPEPQPSPPPPKKRAAKPKPPRDEEPSLDLDLPPPSDEYSQSEPEDGGFTTAMSADGVTRLIVTAYIGIGNKLHIRGDGPGLSWDKGVPLQFVSIGKWRWETHDATAPIAFKLYKNDSVECTRIGSPKLEPGHQHEVTANF